MSDPVPDRTSVTLLLRVRDEPPESPAWRDFVACYGPRIRAFCLARRLQPADADDVTQAVLLKLTAAMRRFRYDPTRSFRAWLRQVTRNAVVDFLTERRVAGGDAIDRLDQIEAREGLACELEAGYERELLEEAMRRVRSRVPERQWEAFRLTALEGLSGAEAGERLDMLVATVFTSRSKVQKLLREEVARLGEG
jgi:RNA polymerase sigma factor (sigma-70 family)